jgi:ubiquinone biosynthesis protein
MPPLFRRLLLLSHALRFGVRLFWLAAPREHKLHWAITLIERVHESESGRDRLHGILPALGPLASSFMQTLAEQPELATGTLHEAFDAVGKMEVPLPPEQVEAALTKALGRPAVGLFSKIDLIPAQNGFAEQTHVAQLAEPINGHRDISIKFIRADQVQQIGDELALLRWVARWLEKLSGGARRLHVKALAQSFTDDVMRRFDLRAEAANLSQTGHHFDEDKRLVVPDVIWELCTNQTLAVQHIETVAATDVVRLLEHHIRPARLATHIIEVVTEQAFEHGFFHAAFDSRHVRVSIEPETSGRIVLAEFSAMSSLSSHEREFFVHGATALFDQDYGRLADLHRDAGHVHSSTRTEVLEAELRRRSEAHFAAEPEDRWAGALFHHLLHAVQPFEGGAVSPRLATAQRSFAQAEALARALHPGVDTWNVARSVLGDIAQRDLDHRGWIKRIGQELPHLAHMLPRVPQLAVRYLQQRHDASANRQHVQLMQEVGREYRRTRILLWACAVCGGLLGAGAVLLSH